MTNVDAMTRRDRTFARPVLPPPWRNIVPGAKMPNFTVRKDFQERYSVDRRHIYDYFHSRGKHLLRRRILGKFYINIPGLRVAKEDKHTNLTRGRANKVGSQADC